jgi:hypothetical protein
MRQLLMAAAPEGHTVAHVSLNTQGSATEGAINTAL